MPLIDPEHFVGGLHNRYEGHLDPYGTTWAYAKAAKKKGATDEMLNEMIAVAGMANETNRLVEGYQVEVDDFLK